MEITGKIIVALPEQPGVSKAGNQWKKREYVLETLENYPKKVHFDLFGDRADQYPLNVGDEPPVVSPLPHRILLWTILWLLRRWILARMSMTTFRSKGIS